MAPRQVPSSVGLPEIWRPEMDIFICYSDAVATDVSMKLTIYSLKKRFPELENFAISEPAIERRLYCLDRMANDYFKKGAALAVQRLESSGVRLPPEPEWDMSKVDPMLTEHQKKLPPEPVTPTKSSAVPAVAARLVNQSSADSRVSSTARYLHERYAKKPVKNAPTAPVANEGRSSPKELQPAFEASARSDSTIHAAWSEDVSARARASIVKVGPNSSRPSNETGRRLKDVNPAASFDGLYISEAHALLGGDGFNAGRSASNASAPGGKRSLDTPSDNLSQASTANPSVAFSSGSPRQPHTRIRPVASNTRIPTGPRPNDENFPLNVYTPTKFERRKNDLPLRVYTPTNPTTVDDKASTFSSRRYI
ncbi:MAG: hypothetical protein Q9207_001901 [Kuettlingeria erythrocarpa]